MHTTTYMASHTDQCSYTGHPQESTGSFCYLLDSTYTLTLMGQDHVVCSPTLGTGTWFQTADGTQTLACSTVDRCASSWSLTLAAGHTQRTNALQPGKEFEAVFDKVGQTVLIGSRAWPDKGVTYLHI